VDGLTDRELFAFAGLWTSWVDRETGERVDSAAIVTTTPNHLVAGVHNRMPVILDDRAEQGWLDTGTPLPRLLSLLGAYPAGLMSATPASPDVNSVRSDHPLLLVA
jgi:putative SOS response-associated peptidase YedK